MTDREKVMQWLKTCANGCEDGCPYEYKNLVYRVECKADLMSDALELLKAEETRRQNMLRSWRIIKYSVLETANNNADAGNEDYYNLLTWLANMMNQQEAKWDD